MRTLSELAEVSGVENGEPLTSKHEVEEYFTIDNMIDMFGVDYFDPALPGITEDELEYCCENWEYFIN